MRQAVARLLDRHPIIGYTIARFALFAAVLVPLALIGLRGVALLGVGILISGAIALFALDGIRAGFSGKVSGYFTRLNQRIDDAARAEDEELDSSDATAAPAPAAPTPAAPTPQEASAEQSPTGQAQP